jgi:hypothetical protein
MATRTVCDRCGGFVEDGTSQLAAGLVERGESYAPTKRIDICKKCWPVAQQMLETFAEALVGPDVERLVKYLRAGPPATLPEQGKE